MFDKYSEITPDGWQRIAESLDRVHPAELVGNRDGPFLFERPSLPKYLWHYTTAQGLNSILSGGVTLWASSSLYMNDPLEYKWSQDSLRKLDKDTGGFDRYTKKIIANLTKNTAPYIVSLSDAEDDLPQWKSYGGNGYGYAIRFKVDALLSEASATVQNAKNKFYSTDRPPRVLGDAGDVVGINEVYYVSEEDQAGIIRSIFDFTKSCLYSDLEIQIANTLAVSKVSPWIKRQGYANEHEFRLVLQDLQPAPVSSKVANYLPVGTHLKGNIFVPHVELNIPSSVDKIVIGPSLKGYRELARIGLRELLDKSVRGKVGINPSAHHYQG